MPALVGVPRCPASFTEGIIVSTKGWGSLPSLQKAEGFLKPSKPTKNREKIRFQAETNTKEPRVIDHSPEESASEVMLGERV